MLSQTLQKPQNTKTQTLPGLYLWTALGGLQCPFKPPSYFITRFASESAHYAHCFPSLRCVITPLARIYLMSTLISEKHVACSYGYKLVCVDDKFSKPFKPYLGKDAVCNFISSMIEENKYCNDVIKKHFNKELVMTK